MSEASFNKDTTYQGRGMGIRKISKENKDTNENNKQKHRIASRVPVDTEPFNFPYVLYLILKGEEGKRLIQHDTKTTRTVTWFNA